MPAGAETSKLRTGLAAGTAVAVVVALLGLSPVVERLELRTRDLRNEWTRRPRIGDDPFGHPAVGLVMVTQESIDWFQQQTQRPWPWPREAFGYLFRACAIGGADAILFDFFTHIDPDPTGTEKEWVVEMKKAPPAWVAVPFSDRALATADAREDLSAVLDRHAIPVDSDGSVELPEPYASVALPVPAVAGAVAGICDVSTPRDVDGVIRRYRLLSRFRGRHYPSFALAALMAREKVRQVRIRGGVVEVGRLSIPVERDGTVRIRYVMPFHYMSASPVISGVWDLEEKGSTTQFDPARLKGRAVVMGTNAPSLFDLRATPVGEMAGAEIHATALRNLLSGELLRPVPAALGLAVLAVLAVGTALGVRHASAAAGAGAAVGIAGAYAGLSVLLFSAGRIVDLVGPLLAVGLSYGAASSLNFLFEGRQRLRTKREFQRYMSPKVVEKILRNPDALRMKGERKTLTIFFMDFAGFTSMSEKLDPAEVVRLINEYHNEAAEEIFRTEGTLDKYIGDAIMAFWNDPLEQPDHALRACRTALRAQERLKVMAVKMREAGLPEMTARIGINTGLATVGNMGAKNQVSYTAIGDEVNLASRLEGVNKEFGTDIIVAESTLQPARDVLETRELALIKVKGKKQPVRIFELLGAKGEVPEARLRQVRAFEKAVEVLRARRFAEARAAFEALAAEGDRPSAVYAAISEAYLSSPPPADWDGSYQMDHK